MKGKIIIDGSDVDWIKGEDIQLLRGVFDRIVELGYKIEILNFKWDYRTDSSENKVCIEQNFKKD